MLKTIRIKADALCALAVLGLLLSFPALAFAATYSSSAHGSTSYGVLRGDGSLPTIYARGNCGHCHEQHASVEGSNHTPNAFLLLTGATTQADENSCYQCHGNGSVMLVTNDNYAATFGGATAESLTIYNAFTQTGSTHDLSAINTFLTTYSGTFDVPDKAAPCSGCHNVHLARANHRDTDDPTDTAISRPTDHENLWGDDPDERMPDSISSALEYYQPPYSASSGYEPDDGSGTTAQQAIKTPDYSTFCTDCHNMSTTITGITSFNWSLEQHGGGGATNNHMSTEMMLPYTDANLGDYTLSCLDCHEPHGSSNLFLLRSSVNGGDVSLTHTTNDWDNLCQRCHVASDSNALQAIHHDYKNDLGCIACHFCNNNQGQCITNSNPKIRDCSICHYHGAYRDGYKTF